MLNEKKLRYILSKENGYYKVFYDVTELFSDLPIYITKIEVCFAEYLDEDELKLENILEYFERAFQGEPVFNNVLSLECAVTNVYFMDNSRLEVSFSEGGLLEFIRGGRNNSN